jgi:flagellar motility protein MotE (MotC chaperone)
MAEYGEWNRKGATLSDVTARKEYGVSQAFIVKGIREGKLEYREGSIWGNPYLKILRRQLEGYITEQRGSQELGNAKNQGELKKVNRDINSLKRKLAALQHRKAELEKVINK